MAIAFVAAVGTAGNVGGATTGTINTTGASLLVSGWPQYDGGSALTFEDSKGNTWTPLTRTTSGDNAFRLVWSSPTSVGSGHDFTTGGSNVYGGPNVIAFSGAHASPFDQQNSNDVSVTTEAQTGSVTPSEDNEVIVAGMSINGNPSFASQVLIDSGFTITHAFGSSGTNYAHVIAYKIQASAGAENPLFEWASSGSATLGIATFKAAAGGGGGNEQPMRRRWGGVPFMGGNMPGGHKGQMWGQRRSGVMVPRRYQEAA